MHNFLGLWEDDGRVGLGALKLSGEAPHGGRFNIMIYGLLVIGIAVL